MSKDDSEKKSFQHGGRRSKGGHKNQGFKKDSMKPAKPVNSDEAVPILKFGPNNNYVTFKDKLKTACVEKYGDLGRLIKDEAYWEPPEVDRTEFPNADSDIYEKQALIEAIKERASLIRKMKIDKSSMYAYIMSKMSPESIDEIKRHRDYSKADDAFDPLELWKIVKEIHMISTKSKSVRVVKRKSCEEYYACKQGAFESLVDFKARFDTRFEAYKQQGNPPKDDEDVAMDFLESLDKTRYGEFVCDILNDIAKGVMKEPQNVNEVYVLANTRVTMKKGSGYNVGASYTTIGAISKQRRNKNKNRGKGGRKENDTNADSGAEDTPARKPEEKKKKERNLENVECFNCGNKGHYARDCPENEDDDDEEPLAGMTLKDDEGCFLAGPETGRNFYMYEILLDSGSQVNCVHPRFLQDLREGAGGFRGLSGARKKVNKVGKLAGFFDCLACEDAKASVLSLADVEDLYEVSYIPKEAYIVHMNDRDLVFKRRNKLYVADFSDWIDQDFEESYAAICMMTVAEKEHMYTKKEVERAKRAGEFVKNAGFPSEGEAVNLVRDGNVENVPVSVEDIRAFYDIYGVPVAAIRGKMTKKKRAAKEEIDLELKEERKIQVLTTDVMAINGELFLVSVASPLELTMSTHLISQSKPRLGEGLQAHINLLRSFGFDARMVIVDPLKGLVGLKGSFPGVEINPTGAGDHLHKVDAKIRRIKETARSIISGLPYVLPKTRVKDLVTFVVNRLNTRRTKALNDNVSPRTKLTGKKVSYHREFVMGFGDYVEAFDPKARSNSMDARSEPCIALYPAANVTGSWMLWSLKSQSYVRRSNWKRLPMPELVVMKMNELAGGTKQQLIEESAEPEDTVVQSNEQNEQQIVRADTIVPQEPMRVTVTPEEAQVEAEEEVQETSEMVENNEMSEAPDSEPIVEEYDEDVVNEPEPVLRRTERSNAGKRSQDSDYLYSLTQMSISVGIKTHGEVAEEAIRAEFDQLFNKKKALQPVKLSSLSKTQRKKILRSSMFLKEKYDGRGTFEKLKGRLVADGRMQDRTLYQDKESKMAAIESIMMALGIASWTRMKAAKVDVGGAYLNAFVEQDDEIFMRLSAQITGVLVKYFPELKEYLEEGDDRLLVKILKAMYGLVQSAALWYEMLTRFLKEELGFVQNKMDPCVMHKTTDNGKLLIIVLYVDDVLILCEDDDAISWVIDELKTEYKEVAVERGDELSYLGMALKRNNDGSFEISMETYIKSVLESFPEYADIKKCITPTTPKLFHPDTSLGKLLNKESKERFHTTVARLLYLSKRGRPDIQLPVLFLCSRVQSPTRDDDLKLRRILGYLKLTRNKRRMIRVSKKMMKLIVEFFIDASFATHPDGKGHTGMIVVMCGIAIISFSKKQKIATKDSTESEIVAFSDMLIKIEWVVDFLRSFGLEVDTPIVYQDNKSAITLVTKKESGIARTRHLQARRAVLYEGIMERNSVIIMFLRTAQMVADVLTKPLGGQLFYNFANVLMGCTTVLTDFAETTGVRWKNSIVTAVSPTGEAGVTEKTFKVRPEPVEGVEYNGPIEKYERKNVPHILEEDEDSIGVYRYEEQSDPA